MNNVIKPFVGVSSKLLFGTKREDIKFLLLIHFGQVDFSDLCRA